MPRDPAHQNGWDYDPATNPETFYRSLCDTLKTGQVSDVGMVFGCNQPTPR